MWQRRASSSTVRSSARFSTIQVSSGPSVSASQSGTARAMNWAWPPERCGGTTIRRAAVGRDAGAELLAHQVERGVEPGCRAGTGDDRAVLHVEDVRVDQGLRVALGQQARRGASGWCTGDRRAGPASPSTKAAVQCAKTKAPRAWAARHDVDHLRRGLEVVALGGDAHQVGVGHGVEAVRPRAGRSRRPRAPGRAAGWRRRSRRPGCRRRGGRARPTPRTSHRARTARPRPGPGPSRSAWEEPPPELAGNQCSMTFLPLVAGSRPAHDFCHDLPDDPSPRGPRPEHRDDAAHPPRRSRPPEPPASHFEDPRFRSPALG